MKKRLSLDKFEMHNVLEIDVLDNRKIRKLAQHIEARGEHYRYSLYSVDAHLAQRFFINLESLRSNWLNGMAFHFHC